MDVHRAKVRFRCWCSTACALRFCSACLATKVVNLVTVLELWALATHLHGAESKKGEYTHVESETRGILTVQRLEGAVALEAAGFVAGMALGTTVFVFRGGTMVPLLELAFAAQAFPQ